MIEQKGLEPQPTSKELHQQFSSLYNALPLEDSVGDIEILATNLGIDLKNPRSEEEIDMILSQVKNRMNNRAHSETKKKLLDKYSTILRYSLLTNPGNQYLLNSYNMLYLSGLNSFKQMDEIDNTPSIVSILKIGEDTGGIFDSITSPDIEKNLYHYALNMHKIVAGYYTPEQIENLIKRKTPSGKMAVILKKWRNEYVNKYQDEP